MTTLLEDALRKVAALPRDEQEAIASQIMETLRDEAAWKEKLARNPEKLRRLAEEACKNAAAAKRGLSMNSCDRGWGTDGKFPSL
jgi:hypothetical protein